MILRSLLSGVCLEADLTIAVIYIHNRIVRVIINNINLWIIEGYSVRFLGWLLRWLPLMIEVRLASNSGTGTY